MTVNGLDGLRGAGGVQGPGGGAGSVGGAAKADDVTRFQDAMKAPDETSGVSPAQIQDNAVAEAGNTQSADSLGDRILKGIGALDGQIQSGRANAAEVLSKQDVTQADLLRAESELLGSKTLVSLVSKTASSLTQSIKTLQQG